MWVIDPGLTHCSNTRQIGFRAGRSRGPMEQIERYQALQTLVPGFPDRAHAASADESHKAVSPGDRRRGPVTESPLVQAWGVHRTYERKTPGQPSQPSLPDRSAHPGVHYSM